MQRNGVKRLFLSRLEGFVLMLHFADEENQVQRACAVLKVAGLVRTRPDQTRSWIQMGVDPDLAQASSPGERAPALAGLKVLSVFTRQALC